MLTALGGDHGKPRPALAVQSDLFAQLASIVVCPLSSFIRTDAQQFRLTVEPTAANGLMKISQINIDKIITVPLAKIGGVIGVADEALMVRVSRALGLFLSVV